MHLQFLVSSIFEAPEGSLVSLTLRDSINQCKKHMAKLIYARDKSDTYFDVLCLLWASCLGVNSLLI